MCMCVCTSVVWVCFSLHLVICVCVGVMVHFTKYICMYGYTNISNSTYITVLCYTVFLWVSLMSSDTL